MRGIQYAGKNFPWSEVRQISVAKTLNVISKISLDEWSLPSNEIPNLVMLLRFLLFIRGQKGFDLSPQSDIEKLTNYLRSMTQVENKAQA